MDRVGIENESVKINRFTIFSFAILTALFIFFRQYGYLRMPALEALFPVSTSVILVLHGLLALFMLMKFNFERNHLYLVVLAFVYGVSSIWLVNFSVIQVLSLLKVGLERMPMIWLSISYSVARRWQY